MKVVSSDWSPTHKMSSDAKRGLMRVTFRRKRYFWASPALDVKQEVA